jgi:signal transduction histidine kinase
VVPLLQRTIGEVRAIATALRPSSLDDLGLRSAISALSRDIGTLQPDLDIHEYIVATEEEIPTPLKIVIYRCLEIALHGIVRLRQATRVRVMLQANDGNIALVIEHDGRVLGKLNSEPDASGGQDSVTSFISLRERVILSGGELCIENDLYGATTMRAQWQR